MSSFGTDTFGVSSGLPRDPVDIIANLLQYDDYETVYRAMGNQFKCLALYKGKKMLRSFSLIGVKAPANPFRAHLVEQEEEDDRLGKLSVETVMDEGGLFERITQSFAELFKFKGFSNYFETTLHGPLDNILPLFKLDIKGTAFTPRIRVSEVDMDLFTNRPSEESSDVAFTLDHNGVELVKTLFGDAPWSAKEMVLSINDASSKNLVEICEHVISHCSSSLLMEFLGVEDSVVQGLRDALFIERMASLPNIHKVEISTNFAPLHPEVLSFGEVINLLKGGVKDLRIGGGLFILEYSEDAETLLRIWERAIKNLSSIEGEFLLVVALRCTTTPAWFPQETLFFPTPQGRIEVTWADWAGEASEVKISSFVEATSD